MTPIADFDEISEHVAQVRLDGGRAVIADYEPSPSSDVNELLVFLKPELTGKYPADRRTFDVVMKGLSSFNCTAVASAVLGPRYLERHRLIEAHYGLINTYSNRGLDALPAAARNVAAEAIRSEKLPSSTAVLGAHQVLAMYPEVSPDDLLSWHDQATDTVRLASGAYAFFHSFGEDTVLIIDGFHPAQLLHFYGTDDPIVVMVVRSPRSWVELRINMCGATNPAKAAPGSIRSELLDRREELDLSTFDSMRNGVHVSAGPVEAAVEIGRYLSDFDGEKMLHFRETSFGQVLADSLSDDRLHAIATNAEVPLADGTCRAAFDATEHTNSQEALELLSADA